MKGMRLIVGCPSVLASVSTDALRQAPEPIEHDVASLRVVASVSGPFTAVIDCRAVTDDAPSERVVVRVRTEDILLLASNQWPLGIVTETQTQALRIDVGFAEGEILPCHVARPEVFARDGFDGRAMEFVCALDDQTAEDFAPALSLSSGYAGGIPDAHRILSRLVSECRRVDAYTSCVVAACVVELMVLIAREAGAGQTRSDVFEAVETFLRENLDRRIPLSEIAHVSGLNASYLCRRFKELYGDSPIAHHTELRLRQAAWLIAAGRGVAEAGVESGFKSIYHFSNSFKRHYGVPPSRYLNEQR